MKEGENLEGASGKDHSLFHERCRAFKYDTTRVFDVYCTRVSVHLQNVREIIKTCGYGQVNLTVGEEILNALFFMEIWLCIFEVFNVGVVNRTPLWYIQEFPGSNTGKSSGFSDHLSLDKAFQ